MNNYVMDIFYTSSKLIHKLIWGSLDFYFFAGSSPLDVVQQLIDLIGYIAAMPYWASGMGCRTRVDIIDVEKKRWEKSYDLLCLSQVAAVEGNRIFKTANPVFESLNVYSTYMLIMEFY